jgi:hypothetical protein
MESQLDVESVTRKKQAEGESDTTIQVSIELRERIKSYGRKGETYGQVIERILDEYDSLVGRKHK